MIEFTIKLQSDDEKSWGVCLNFSDHYTKWQIQTIMPGGQFDSHGIRPGWKIVQVENFQLNEANYKNIQRLLKDGKPMTIKFRESVILKFLFYLHLKRITIVNYFILYQY